MPKDILFNKQALEKTLAGLDLAANAVSGTMGPKGGNVYFDTELGPEITNDGATVADRVHLADNQEDAGAYIIRNVTAQTNDDAGDGTTTTAVLTQAIIHECLNRPENSNVIKQSLSEAGKAVLEKLAKSSTKLKKEDIYKVAYISAEDETIAKLITEIIEKLGEKAVINVEDSKTFATEYEIVDGYEAKAGFMSPHFITDKQGGKSIYENVHVLVTEKKIQNIADITPIFEIFKQQGINQCVIVCEDIDDSMLGVFVTSKNVGTFHSLVVRASSDILRDIEGVVGAQRVSDATGVTFKNLKLENLGVAKKIVSDANKTLFLGNGESSKRYAQLLEVHLAQEENMFVKRQLEKRIAKLKGGIATLRIGAPTDPERIYLRRKAEDAVKATLAALEEGVVEGGGMALYKLSEELESSNGIGQSILHKALKAPLKKIITNCGEDYAEVIKNLPKGQGYDAKSGQYVDMLASGILDPAKVTRCALENAVSIAGTFITTFCLITESNKDNERKQ